MHFLSMRYNGEILIFNQKGLMFNLYLYFGTSNSQWYPLHHLLVIHKISLFIFLEFDHFQFWFLFVSDFGIYAAVEMKGHVHNLTKFLWKVTKSVSRIEV